MQICAAARLLKLRSRVVLSLGLQGHLLFFGISWHYITLAINGHAITWQFITYSCNGQLTGRCHQAHDKMLPPSLGISQFAPGVETLQQNSKANNQDPTNMAKHGQTCSTSFQNDRATSLCQVLQTAGQATLAKKVT